VARERSTHAEFVPAMKAPPRHEPDARVWLTPSEVHAMRRSAPLTPEQFKELGRLAEQGISPLRHF